MTPGVRAMLGMGFALLGLLLCATIILIPLGIPLLLLGIACTVIPTTPPRRQPGWVWDGQRWVWLP